MSTFQNTGNFFFKDSVLKLSCFLTGFSYSSLKNYGAKSRAKVLNLGLCVLLLGLLWGFVFYRLASIQLDSMLEIGKDTKMIIQLLFGLIGFFIIVVIERPIIHSPKARMDNKSLAWYGELGEWAKGKLKSLFSVKGFRLLLTLCIAAIGSLVIEDLIYHNDIEVRLNEVISLKRADNKGLAFYDSSLNSLNIRQDKLARSIDSINNLAIQHSKGLDKNAARQVQQARAQYRTDYNAWRADSNSRKGPPPQYTPPVGFTNNAQSSYQASIDELRRQEEGIIKDKNRVLEERKTADKDNTKKLEIMKGSVLERQKAVIDVAFSSPITTIFFWVFFSFFFLVDMIILAYVSGSQPTQFERELATEDAIGKEAYETIRTDGQLK